MYFKKPRLGEYYYAIPEYMSAGNYIAADGALSRYYNNYIRNNFSANMSITFPNEPSEEQKEALYNNLKASFGGETNAGNIIMLFGENGSLPSMQPIESVNADLYNSVEEIIRNAIVSANRLTSPVLAGITTKSGFSSKSDEIIAATVQYRLSVINSDRQFLLEKFNNLLSMNGFNRVFNFEDYDLTKEFEGGNTDVNNDKTAENIDVETGDEQEINDKSTETNVNDKQVGE